jgi:DNA-binding response OmpR family regulator
MTLTAYKDPPTANEHAEAFGPLSPAVNIVFFGTSRSECANQTIASLRKLGARIRIVSDVEEYFCNTYINDNLLMLEWERKEFRTISTLKYIRSLSDLPLLILSSSSEEIERVIALELGADDFFHTELGSTEILAKIRALFRRLQKPNSIDAENGDYICFSDWIFDKRRMRLRRHGGEDIILTRGEISLLMIFVDAPLRILSRSYLARATHVHGSVTDRAVDVQILRLRKKLDPGIIECVRGQGYRFTERVENRAQI